MYFYVARINVVLKLLKNCNAIFYASLFTDYSSRHSFLIIFRNLLRIWNSLLYQCCVSRGRSCIRNCNHNNSRTDWDIAIILLATLFFRPEIGTRFLKNGWWYRNIFFTILCHLWQEIFLAQKTWGIEYFVINTNTPKNP